MRFPAVADAARWYSICSLWGVLLVAVHTAHLGLVFAATGLYGLGLLRVAQDTMLVVKR